MKIYDYHQNRLTTDELIHKKIGLSLDKQLKEKYS